MYYKANLSGIISLRCIFRRVLQEHKNANFRSTLSDILSWLVRHLYFAELTTYHTVREYVAEEFPVFALHKLRLERAWISRNASTCPKLKFRQVLKLSTTKLPSTRHSHWAKFVAAVCESVHYYLITLTVSSVPSLLNCHC